VEKGSVMAARRDVPGREGKSFLPQENIASSVGALLDTIQSSLYEKARAFRDSHITDVTNYEALTTAVQDGWAHAWWCGSADCENRVKEETKATTRCIPMQQPGGTGKCAVCGRDANEKVYFARAY